MKKLKLLAIVLYSVVALITAVAGMKFIMASEYFPYHAQVSGVDWVDVSAGLQLLMLAGFKIIGAGFLGVALSLGLMIIFPFARHGQRWSYFAIPLVGTMFWSIILATTLIVKSTTLADAPWGGALFCVLALMLAFAVSLINPSPPEKTTLEKGT